MPLCSSYLLLKEGSADGQLGVDSTEMGFAAELGASEKIIFDSPAPQSKLGCT